MAVSVDLATEDLRTGTTSPQTFSHGGAASGVRGVILFIIHGTSETDHVSAASYGGSALTRVNRTSVGTEPGASEAWFLGSSIPQGTQTVSYTPGATTDDIYAVVITLLGSDDLEVVDSDVQTGVVTNPSITLQYGGRTCMAFGGMYHGESQFAEVLTPNANCTLVHDVSSLTASGFGAVIRQTTAGSSDFAIGGTCAGDEVAFMALAISEVTGGGGGGSPAFRLSLLRAGR